jgi:hypothetical protein
MQQNLMLPISSFFFAHASCCGRWSPFGRRKIEIEWAARVWTSRFDCVQFRNHPRSTHMNWIESLKSTLVLSVDPISADHPLPPIFPQRLFFFILFSSSFVASSARRLSSSRARFRTFVTLHHPSPRSSRREKRTTTAPPRSKGYTQGASPLPICSSN